MYYIDECRLDDGAFTSVTMTVDLAAKAQLGLATSYVQNPNHLKHFPFPLPPLCNISG